MQDLIFTNDVITAIDNVIGIAGADRLFIFTDSNVNDLVSPYLGNSSQLKTAGTIIMPAGENNKNITILESVWEQLSRQGATRQSLLICVGGGTVTDLGGFAAATFKRGIRHINIPTTLLCAVDAATGGKTGINFLGLKNEIGAFHQPHSVIVSSRFFGTLPRLELLSGYAEMLKHTLLKSVKAFEAGIQTDVADIDPEAMLPLMEESVRIKQNIVATDPTEKGIRKTLNLGHTAGHAFESFCLEHRKSITHGHAVAHGLVVELVLSHILKQFPTEYLYRTAGYVRRNYGVIDFTCKDYDRLLEYMRHDKKNMGQSIIFTLLDSPGNPQIDCIAGEDIIRESLDIYRDLLGI